MYLYSLRPRSIFFFTVLGFQKIWKEFRITFRRFNYIIKHFLTGYFRRENQIPSSFISEKFESEISPKKIQIAGGTLIIVIKEHELALKN